MRLIIGTNLTLWYNICVTEVENFFMPAIGINNLICYHQISALAVVTNSLPSVTRSRLATVKAVLFSGQKNRTDVVGIGSVTNFVQKGQYTMKMILSHPFEFINLIGGGYGN